MTVERVAQGATERAARRQSTIRDSPARFLLLWTAEYLPGLFRPVILICALLLAALGLIIVVLLLGFMIIMTGGAAMALGSLAYAQALAFIISGEFESLVSALVDFDSVHWTLFLTLLMAPGAIMIFVIKYMVEV